MPLPTHVPIHLTEQNNQKNKELYRTTWDAIGDLDNNDWDETLSTTGKWAELIPSVPEGRNYQWHTDQSGGSPLFGWRTRYWTFLLKLAKNLPSWTIQAVPGTATGPFHWKNRRLSIRELCRLQTIPDDYTIVGNYRDAHRQIGNAVPPAIGYVLGIQIRKQLFRENVNYRQRLIPRTRSDCPKAERRRKVPKKYIELIGKHAPHPGVGYGPRAANNSI